MRGHEERPIAFEELPNLFGSVRGMHEAFVPARHNRKTFVETQGAHRTHVDIAAQNFYLRVLRPRTENA